MIMNACTRLQLDLPVSVVLKRLQLETLGNAAPISNTPSQHGVDYAPPRGENGRSLSLSVGLGNTASSVYGGQ